MKVSALTLLILHINSLIDSGKYSDISIEDIYDAIEGKRVLRFLKERTGSDIDLSIHLGEKSPYGDFESYYESQIESICGGYAGRESKWGIKNSGLCLILAWTNEIIQQGNDLKWSH